MSENENENQNGYPYELARLRSTWRGMLNVMQRLDVEIEIARTCQREPHAVYVGRKENYELKRDWQLFLTTDVEGRVFVRGLRVVVVDETEHLEVV